MLANNSKHIKTMEGFEAREYTPAEYVAWAYNDTMRNAKTARNFILSIQSKLMSYEDKVSQTLLPKLHLSKQ